MSAIFDLISEQLPDLLSEHWVFLLVAGGLSVVGEFFKRFVWTKERATQGRLWLWGRRTLPFHPVLVGLAIDFFRGEFYFVGSGVLAIWMFNVIKQIVRKRWRIELSLWGDKAGVALHATVRAPHCVRS